MAKRTTGRPTPLARRPTPPSWHLLLSLGLVAVAALVLLYAQWRSRPVAAPVVEAVRPAAAPPAADRQSFADTLFQGAEAALAEVGIQPGLIAKTRGAPDRVQVAVPGDLALTLVNLQLTHFAEERGGEVLGAVETVPGKKLELRCGFAGAATTLFALEQKRELQRTTGQLAVVIGEVGPDGWGDPLIERFLELPQSLTFALLPSGPRVAELAAQAREAGHEVLAYLPMESGEDGPDAGEDAVSVEDEEQEIREKVRQALGLVPRARGIASFLGSRATADYRVMDQVLAEMKGRGLYFLDSRTSAASVAGSAAAGTGVRFVGRDLLLDEEDDQEAVEQRLWELSELATRNGQAV
ncbi:MAG: divergent polysaccharide deacetylase family protein, partial [Candidatus Latescibacterota bacterium]